MMAAPCPRAAPSPPERAGRAERSARSRAAARTGNRDPASLGQRDGDGGTTEPWSGSPWSKLTCLCGTAALLGPDQLFQHKQVKFLLHFLGIWVLWQHQKDLHPLIIRAKGYSCKVTSLLS